MDASRLCACTDPGSPPAAGIAPIAEPSWLDTALRYLADIPVTAWTVVGLSIALAVVAARVRAARRGARTTAPASDKLMTFFGAVVATGVVATGMWQFFGDVLHIGDPIVRVALFAFFEIAMLAEALRSRRFRLGRAQRADERAKERAKRLLNGTPTADLDQAEAEDRQGLDVDGIAVWVLALCSGSFAAMDQDTRAGAGLRLVAPIVAAWLWERGLAGELQHFRRPARRASRINWTVSPERVAVWLRLAEPTGREVDDVDRARRRAAFTVAAYRLHTLRIEDARQWRISRAQRRLRRAGLDIMERFGVAALRDAQMDVATLYGIEDGTSPEAVRHLTPWQSSAVGVAPERIAITATAATATGIEPATATGSATATATPAATEQPPPPPAEKVVPPKQTATATPGATATPPPATPTSGAAQTATGSATATPEPTPQPTPPPPPAPKVAPRPPATGGGKSKTPTVSQADIDAIRDGWDDAFRAGVGGWNEDQAKAYAAEEGLQVSAETGSKTDGMHRYWLVMKALGHGPKGSPMADAVGAAPSLGRRLASGWETQLLIADVEDAFGPGATDTQGGAATDAATASGGTR